MKFATFYDGNSYQFPASEPDADFLQAFRNVDLLARTGKRAEALSAAIAAAQGDRSSLQVSAALERAAELARFLNKHDQAAELAAKIPLEAVKKTPFSRTGWAGTT